jgi:eukaryotic-like serine/threonine-protein kinase
MATFDKPKAANAIPLDLLPVIRRSGVLPERLFDEVRAKVLRGDYPNDSRALAERLVRDKIISEYQALRFLNNKSHGLVIGQRYVIVDRLGSGSMGRVYKAQHLHMGRMVAVKIISPEVACNERVVARFQREMRLVGRLDHPNVVRAYDADRIDNVLYIVMEYVGGLPLSQRVRSGGPIPPVEVVNYATQAARGLAHAHAQGIVHRDIKPSNLFLTDDRQIKILDLGLGVLMEADNHATFQTADGIAVGTIDYMSPEQACGQEVDGRSDLYSLGCAMYYLMTGLLAFPGDSPIERLGKRINGRPVPITDALPDLPPRVVQTMDKLMANRPSDRFQSAEEAAQALHSLTRKKPARRPAPVAAPSPPPAEVPPPAPAEPASPPPPPPPAYPAWFQPLASLVERSPTGALCAAVGLLAATFALGLILGWALF